ncbi:mitochondrial carrier domain-containing protein [Sporodiniella umbellata]|nr:mitochondrial carrier domain-containing protein [Sporodiniella umbellata]
MQNNPNPTFMPFPSSLGGKPYYTPGFSGNYANFVPEQGVSYYPTPPEDVMDSRVAARELVNFTVLKYLTTAANSPFEVSKTLLQVQYLPRQRWVESSVERTTLDKDESESEPEILDDSDEETEQGQDSTGDDPLNPGVTLDADDVSFKKKVPVNADGYIVQGSVYDDSTRPPHQLQPIDGGVWQGIQRLVHHEGWSSLFKGQYTHWLYEISHLFLQPTLEGTLNDLFDLYDDTIPLVHLDHAGPNLATLVASNLIVGFILSPLELIRTRMIVQSASPLQRKYKGPFHALSTLLREEGGLSGLYFSHHFMPTVLFHTITPLLQNVTPLIIDRVLCISANESPFLYSLAELGLNTLEVLITLPLDTIRKRMQCQIRSRTPGSKRFETVVSLRPMPYTSVMHAVYCITREEGSRPAKHKTRNQSRWSLQGLYRGFTMECTSNIVLFFLHAINGIEDEGYEDF